MKFTKFTLWMSGVLVAVLVVQASSISPELKLGLLVIGLIALIAIALRYRPTFDTLAHPRDGEHGDLNENRDR